VGHLDLKIRKRMSGYDSPQQYDVTLVAELRRPSSVDAIKMAIDRNGGSGADLEGEQAADPRVGRLPAELSVCRRMPSPTSQVIDASKPSWRHF
jgi:hypothetical protein